jgi:metal-responsive CopG/Arc/MetJ family transcriptional regulator
VAARAARKIVVDFPEPTYTRIEKASLELNTSRNAFIRLAVERFLDERELVAGYQANAKFNHGIAQDFSHVDAENI